MTFRRLSIAWFALAICACGGSEPELPTLHAIPEFTANDQAGQAVTASVLDGQVTVTNFIFTSCPSICPMLTTQMRNFQQHLGDDAARVRLMSVSVDPETDTPERLAEYAALHGADLSTWRFVTLGDVAATRELVMGGYRVRMGEQEPAVIGDGYDIMHASHFVLVDQQRRVRGYYSSNAEGLADLQRDVRRLLPDR